MSSGHVIHHICWGVCRIPPRGILRRGGWKIYPLLPLSFGRALAGDGIISFDIWLYLYADCNIKESLGEKMKIHTLFALWDQILSARWLWACVHLSIVHMAKIKSTSMYVRLGFYLRLRKKIMYKNSKNTVFLKPSWRIFCRMSFIQPRQDWGNFSKGIPSEN